MPQSHLFSPLTMRGIELRNRIGVSPMCMYSCEDGFATDWHLVHLGSRAVGGAALVLTEAIAVEARGRISPHDLGIYRDEHVENLSRIAAFVKAHGAAPGTQLAHAGRKASTARPWDGDKPLAPDAGGWSPVIGPSPIAFTDDHPVPLEMTAADIEDVVSAFEAGARRSLAAGFEIVEIHGAHGYLIHEFLSPLSNKRTDEYGGSFDNRIRLLLRIVERVRGVWPERLPLFARLSTTDWVEGGWTVDESVELARRLAERGVDAIDSSSGGNVARARIPVGPGFQTPMAQRIRAEAGLATAAVGLITSPQQADHIIRTGQADFVLLGREFLRDPYWPANAAVALGQPAPIPMQYARAWPG